jgi:8-oxo-dGTP diphosphatase
MQTHTVAKTIIFNGAGKLLALRRSEDDTHRPGGFDFPGGQVNDGETIVAGAIREAAEESGLQLKAEGLQLVFATTKVGYHVEQEANINIVWIGFVTTITGDQTVRLSHEHQRFDWYTLEEALAECDGPTQKQFLSHVHDYKLVSGLLPGEK